MATPKEERATPKLEAPGDELRLVVEISSSSEESTSSEEAGEEATSSALLSPRGKRAAFLDPGDLPVLPASAENSRKRPKFSEQEQTENSDSAAWMSPDEEEGDAFDLPPDFLEPLQPEDIPLSDFALALADSSSCRSAHCTSSEIVEKISRQFWKAGDYSSFDGERNYVAGGIDHVRVHPKFLHSNATSHKWALGAIAELLDNALDEAVNGAKRAIIDMVPNPRDGSPMLVIEDDGGGMDPERMRQCMSLGYSAKSKIANTIGQYGNGFKTSTMRLGADVIVFSRCPGRDGVLPSQSVGMLSYTFLTATGQEDIFVPMIDYEVQPFGMRKIIRGNLDDWNRNMETILQWSPYVTEKELLDQLNRIKHQGTVVIVYNLWEDEQGETELDFDADRHDIQLRGTNRDEKNISMANKYPNCKHFFTYRYSLRNYVSILYLRLPVGFKIILRGKEVRHHNLVHDLMLTQKLTYRPQTRTEHTPKDYRQMMAVVTIGFLKDAREHVDVQGFNVYHKNRLIKPFWRLWNLPGSQGRGIVGVLEANFVEPAHDKQDFERTLILSRLEARLLEIQRKYWSKNCHEVGYFSKTIAKSAPTPPKMGSARDDRSTQNSSQVIMEVQTPPTRLVEANASNSLSSGTQRQVDIRLNKKQEASIKLISDVPLQPIPLNPVGPLLSQNTAQAHPCKVSVGIGTTHAAEAAVPMRKVDRQEPLQKCASMALPVKSSLRSPMLHIPATAYQNHSVIGQALTAPKPKAGMPPQRQTLVDEGPVVFPGVSVTSQSQAQSSPTLPELSTTVISSKESKKLPKETQSTFDAAALAVTESSISQPGKDKTRANLSIQILLSSQSETLESPLRVGATDISPADLPSTIPRRTEFQQSKSTIQTRTSVNLDQGSATTTLRTEVLEDDVMRNGVAGHVAELNTILQPSSNEANASNSTARMNDADRCTILNEIESSAELKAKLEILKQKVKSLQRDLEQITKERDSLKAELEEERKKNVLEDENLQKKLQALFLRVRELEDEKKQVQISRQ